MFSDLNKETLLGWAGEPGGSDRLYGPVYLANYTLLLCLLDTK